MRGEERAERARREQRGNDELGNTEDIGFAAEAEQRQARLAASACFSADSARSAMVRFVLLI
jgi:hypothetical protein